MPELEKESERKVTTTNKVSRLAQSDGGGGGGGNEEIRYIYVSDKDKNTSKQIVRWGMIISIGIFLLLTFPKEVKDVSILGVKFDKVVGYIDLVNMVLCYGLYRIISLVVDVVRNGGGIGRMPDMSFSISVKEIAEFKKTNETEPEGHSVLLNNIWKVFDSIIERIMLFILVVLICFAFYLAFSNIITASVNENVPESMYVLIIFISSSYVVSALLRLLQLISWPITNNVVNRKVAEIERLEKEKINLYWRKEYLGPIKNYLDEMSTWSVLMGLDSSVYDKSDVGHWKEAWKKRPSIHKYYYDSSEQEIYSRDIVAPFEIMVKLKELERDAQNYSEINYYDICLNVSESFIDLYNEIKAYIKKEPYDEFYLKEPPHKKIYLWNI